MSRVKIAELDRYKSNWTIQGVLCSMSDLKSYKKTTDLEMVMSSIRVKGLYWNSQGFLFRSVRHLPLHHIEDEQALLNF